MTRASRPLSMISSPIAQPAYGARYFKGAGSSAPACTMIMLKRAVLLKQLANLRHLEVLLADGHVDADEVLALLVDDRIERDGGLAGLAVADDQLALAAADRDQGVNRLEARLHGRVDGVARDNARGHALDRAERI